MLTSQTTVSSAAGSTVSSTFIVCYHYHHYYYNLLLLLYSLDKEWVVSKVLNATILLVVYVFYRCDYHSILLVLPPLLITLYNYHKCCRKKPLKLLPRHVSCWLLRCKVWGVLEQVESEGCYSYRKSQPCLPNSMILLFNSIRSKCVVMSCDILSSTGRLLI